MQHLVQFGLRVGQRHTSTRDVSSVNCLFCLHIGREEVDEEEDEGEDEDGEPPQAKRRKKTDKSRSWTAPPWRPAYYRQRHVSQHGNAWIEYSAISTEEKMLFFSSKQPIQNS